jgi:hypothetical protein
LCITKILYSFVKFNYFLCPKLNPYYPSMKLKITSFLALLLSLCSQTWAQNCPPSYVPKPTQDCAGAIPICKYTTTYASGAICGAGTIPNELPSGSCLSTNEKNTTWYVMKIRTSGLLRFKIQPLDVINNNSGDTDYDWALFKLPAGQTNSPTTCNLIKNNISWQFSCNYSSQKGVTGMWDTVGTAQMDSQGASGSKFNRPRQVNAGEVYVLAVDNLSGGEQIGYFVQFMHPLAVVNGTTADVVPLPDTIEMQPATQFADCSPNKIRFSFDRAVVCDSVRADKFEIAGINTPVIESISAINGCSFEGQAQSFQMTFSSTLAVGNYQLKLKGSIRDVCENNVTLDSIPFRVENSPTALIVQNGAQLSANFVANGTYQWYFDSIPLTGATQQTITPATSGTYFVKIQSNGCVAVSNQIPVQISGIQQNLAGILRLFPNPSTGIFSLEVQEPSEVSIADVTGKVIKQFSVEGTHTLDLSQEANGLYFLTLRHSKGAGTMKIMVQK